jgi:hypothetical protein
MARQHTALALFCSSVLACAVVACDGDDTNTAPTDAGTDATTISQDSGNGDSSIGTMDAGTEDAGPCTPYDAAGLSDAEVHLGISVVVAEHCQVCHGESLSGNDDGVNSPGYGTAFPPNLTPDRVTGLGCWSDQQIETAFLHGVDNNGNVLCPPMPHFGEEDGGITQAEADGVLAFLRSLPTIANQVPASPNCSLPPDGGSDSGTEPMDAGGHHHNDGGFDQDAGPDGGVTDSGTDSAIEDAAADDAG